MKIGYIRSEKKDDFFEKQYKILSENDCGRIFIDLNNDLKELDHLVDFSREGDSIYVYQLERFGLNVAELMKFTYDFLARNIFICSINDNIDTSSSEGELLFKIFNVLTLCEQNAIKKSDLQIPKSMATESPKIIQEPPLMKKNVKPFLRTQEPNNQKIGRPKGLTVSAKEKAVTAASMYQDGNMSMREIANNLSISTATLYSYLRHERVI